MKRNITFVVLLFACLVMQCFSQATGVPVANMPTGGTLNNTDFTGSSTWNFQQTTSGQTITIPDVSPTTNGKNINIRHIGSASFTLSATGVNVTINPGDLYLMQWQGSGYAALKTGTVTSVGITSSNLSASGTVLSSGNLTVNLPNTGVTAGSYDFVTVDATGRVTSAYNSSTSVIASRTFGTAYQASNTSRVYDLDFTIRLAIGASLISTNDLQIILEISADGSTNWTEYTRMQNGNGGIASAQNTQSGIIVARDIPASYWYRLRQPSSTGTVTATYITGHETLRR